MVLRTRRVQTGIPFQPNSGRQEARRSAAATLFLELIVVKAIEQTAAAILFLGDIVEKSKLRLNRKQGTGNNEYKRTRNMKI